MKKLLNKSLKSFLFLCLVSLIFTQTTFAAFADGEYSVNYTVLKGDNDSASIANDYFAKPAKVIVKDGKVRVQITLNKSGWTKSLSLDGSAGTVISNNPESDKRTVEFPVSDISKPVVSKMHIQIPDMNYDNNYTVRFSFDASSIPQASAPAATDNTANNATNDTTNNATNNTTNNVPSTTNAKVEPAKSDSKESTSSSESTKVASAQNGNAVENPKTGDTSNVVLLYALLAISSVFLVNKIRKTHFSKA